MRNKFKLLLLDANIVIHLFKLGIWDKVVTQCDIRLAHTVVEEAHFYETDEGERVDFDLAPYVAAAQVHVFDVMPSDLVRFRRTFKALFLEQMDPGETESLAWLLANPSEPRLCSADAIVFRVLGALGLAERGISLEEILSQVPRSLDQKGLRGRLARSRTERLPTRVRAPCALRLLPRETPRRSLDNPRLFP
jgi:hypothetical protein